MKSFNDYVVDLGVIRNNILSVKRRLSPKTKYCAVVKADAYGLGVEVVCRNIADIVDFFAVANINEAMVIRSFNRVTSILILGHTDLKYMQMCADNDISVSISSFAELESIVINNHKKLKIHLQINTGLNRFGISGISEYKKCLNIHNNNIVIEGVYSHFATKENDVRFINKQLYRFLQFKKVSKDRDIIFHIANSYASTHIYTSELDMVRNGFNIYAGSRLSESKLALSIKSKVVGLTHSKKHGTIGYDRTYTCTKPTSIAVVPLGYADGFDRRLSNNFKVIIGDSFCNVIGNVCMDVFLVDVTGKDVKIGDNVTILGSEKGNYITLSDYAKAMNTSPYDVLLGFKRKRMNYIAKNSIIIENKE